MNVAPPNPFKPTAGATPPLLVGRRAYLEEFTDAIADGPGAPGRLALFTGPRGVGKTVMLTEVGDRAVELGWVVLADTATPGLLDRLTDAALAHLAELDPDGVPRRAVTGVSLPVVGGGVTLSPPPPEPRPQWRVVLTRLVDVLERYGTGVLVTIDEVHRTVLDDMREIAATYQHLVREDREVALVAAGLPSAVSDLLNDAVLTFLRRATQHKLTDVPLLDARAGLRDPIVATGRTIDDAALDRAATATGGYPFLIQLVGYHVWRRAHDGHIDVAAAEAGIGAALHAFEEMVLATAVADLSAVDRAYLAAMSVDDGPSSTAEIATRLGVSMNYANRYRARLVAAGLVQSAGYGLVDLTLPHLRPFLRERADRYRMPRGRRR